MLKTNELIESRKVKGSLVFISFVLLFSGSIPPNHFVQPDTKKSYLCKKLNSNELIC